MARRLISRAVCAAAVALTVAACGTSTRHVGAKTRVVSNSDSVSNADSSTSADAAPVATATTGQQTSALPAGSSTTAHADVVVSCLSKAGLEHATETAFGHWQGVVGDEPLTDETASVFVLGPYSSAAAVRHAVPTAGQGEIAAAGGIYLLVGNAAGHVAAPIRRAAACLRPTASLLGPPTKRSKHYTF
jgi:hypothetical protein